PVLEPGAFDLLAQLGLELTRPDNLTDEVALFLRQQCTRVDQPRKSLFFDQSPDRDNSRWAIRRGREREKFKIDAIVNASNFLGGRPAEALQIFDVVITDRYDRGCVCKFPAKILFRDGLMENVLRVCGDRVRHAGEPGSEPRDSRRAGRKMCV